MQNMISAMAIFFACVSPDKLALFFGCVTPVLGILGEIYESTPCLNFLEAMKPEKRSFLNDEVIKRGLGITLCLVPALQASVEIMYSGGDFHALKRPLARDLAVFIDWLLVTCFFGYVQDLTKVDFSGHQFLQSLLALYILRESSDAATFLCSLQDECAEELQVRAGVSDAITCLADLDAATLARLVKTLKRLEPVCLCLLVTSGMLLLLFTGNFVLTCVYYHSLTEKMVGVAAGILSWGAIFKLFVPYVNEVVPAHHIFDMN